MYFSVQDMVEAECRAAVSIWSSRDEIRLGEDHRKYTTISGGHCLQYG